MKQQLSDNSASEPVCGAGSCDSEELTNLGQRECRCFGLVATTGARLTMLRFVKLVNANSVRV
jgi:hypothetical protein